MKLLVLSDLHVEYAPFQPDLRAVECADVVILAGDIHVGTQGISWARDAFPDKAIVYVAGNHEFYGHHWTQLLDEMRDIARQKDIYFLENEAVTIQGVRFLGATLWTNFEYFGESRRLQNMRWAERNLNDFKLVDAEPLQVKTSDMQKIEDQPGSVFSRSKWQTVNLTSAHTLTRHQESLAWLKSELPKADSNKTVVVTHHYPHQISTHKRWAGDPLTAIFGSKLPEDMLMQAQVWVHGHTHDSCNYRVSMSERSVRVVCNPRGYPLNWDKTEFENAAFNARFILEIPEP